MLDRNKYVYKYKFKNKNEHSHAVKSHSFKRTKIHKSNVNIKNHNQNKSIPKQKQEKYNYRPHARNILISCKQSYIMKSTSTSSLSSSTEKKYLTPTKNEVNNYDIDYYFNENYHKPQKLINIANISRPRLDYSFKKKNKNSLLTIGTQYTLNNDNNTFVTENNNYINDNDYGSESKKNIVINRIMKMAKNKYVLVSKSNNISLFNKFNDVPQSKSLEKREENKTNIKNEDNDEENNFDKKNKYKNIVLRPMKIKKENQIKSLLKYDSNTNINIVKNNKNKKSNTSSSNNSLEKKNIKFPKSFSVLKYNI